MLRFVDRTEELESLEQLWRSGNHAFVIVYGRRRVGKTRLLQEFTNEKDGLFHVAADTSRVAQLTEFQYALGAKDPTLARAPFTTWHELFRYLAKTLDPEERSYLWIDEFSYIVRTDPSITSALQEFIDHFVKRSQLFLIVSGSLFGVMSQALLDHSSPVYGRRTKDILLAPLPVAHALTLLPMSLEDRFKTVLTIGTIPEYLEIAAQYKTYDKFLQAEFLTRNGYFFRELHFLLASEVREVRQYFAILNAIAFGHTRPSRIAAFVGMEQKNLYAYLELLLSFGYVQREAAPARRSDGRYTIKEPFIDAWFNIISRHRNDIEQGSCVLSKEELHPFLGLRFEQLIRQEASRLFGTQQTRRWWHRDIEIDGVSTNAETIVFIESKWREGVDARRIVRSLASRAQYVEHKQTTVEYAILARSLHHRVSEYEGAPVHCIDLADLDRHFERER